MAPKYLKNFGMAATALGCSLGVAQAASTPSPPISPSQLGTFIKPTTGVTGAHRGGGRLGNVAGPRFVSGFNFVVGTQSIWYTPDGNNFFIFCVNTDGSFFFDGINSPLLTSGQAQLQDACKQPGGYFVFVTDPSTGAFNEIVINQPVP
jgi:hypothetical protein